jgi:CHAD domain-containing protein
MSRDIGAENVAKIATYLASVEALPARHGKANITAIALAAGLKDRQALYKNPECRTMLEQAIATKGLRGIDIVADHDPEKAALERKIAELQNKNDALYAEVHELRRQIRKYKHIEEMYQQGKRVIL